jgi:hypothetical protein
MIMASTHVENGKENIVHAIPSDLDLGDLPTWLATVGAFIAAGFAYRALRVEQRRDDRQEIADARVQAECVAAWVIKGSGGLEESFRIVLDNASRLPIFGVRVALAAADGDQSRNIASPGVLPPGRREFPIQFLDLPIELAERDLGPSDDGTTAALLDHLRAIIEFTDAAGLTWTRDSSGILHKSVP